MQILSKNFNLPQNTRTINQNGTKTSNPVSPSFKSGKKGITDLLEKKVKNILESGNGGLEDIFANKKKKETFIDVLATLMITASASIARSLGQEKDQKEEAIEIPTLDNLTQEREEKAEHIEFKTVKGRAPQNEKDLQKFIIDNYKDNQIFFDRLKLLFNQYCGANRNNSHIYEGEKISNKTLTSNILEELKANVNNLDEINNIISKYSNLTEIKNTNIKESTVKEEVQTEKTEVAEVLETSKIPTDIETAEAGKTKPSKAKKSNDIKLPKEMEETLKRYPNIKNEFQRILEETENPKVATHKIETLQKILNPEINSENVDYLVTYAIKNLNKKYCNVLDDVLFVYNHLQDSEKVDFFRNLAYKSMSPDAISSYKDIDYTSICFTYYNNFKSAGLSDEDIKELGRKISREHINDININLDTRIFTIKLPERKTLNERFSIINHAFSIINNKPVTLEAHQDEKATKESIVAELKKDFMRHNRVTYKNLVAYLYGRKHEVNYISALDKHQFDDRFDKIISILNNEEIFNSRLFSNHAKLRFIERFVLNRNVEYNTLEDTIKNNVKTFISDLQFALTNGVTVNPYYADIEGEKTGAQITVTGRRLGTIKITLNNENKIHTIL